LGLGRHAASECVEAIAKPVGAGLEVGVDVGFEDRVLAEVLGDPGAGTGLFATVAGREQGGVRVGDAPAFAVGGDMTRAV
jgi:hypothetical protein